VIIGVPKEIKVQEYRVGLVPGGAKQLVDAGHGVLVQRGAGLGSGIEDAEYTRMGARIVDTADEVWGKADMIIKVKEPHSGRSTASCADGLTLYTYLHLAAGSGAVDAGRWWRAASTCIAYETVDRRTTAGLPLLAPMSARSPVAWPIQVARQARSRTERPAASGLLLGGVPGVAPAHVTVILGGGVVGHERREDGRWVSARESRILDRSLDRLEGPRRRSSAGAIRTLFSDPDDAIERASCASPTLLIGAVLIRWCPRHRNS
jgi:alanine dehydrogenase